MTAFLMPDLKKILIVDIKGCVKGVNMFGGLKLTNFVRLGDNFCHSDSDDRNFLYIVIYLKYDTF